jgi:Flp pilus assembly protein TadG
MNPMSKMTRYSSSPARRSPSRGAVRRFLRVTRLAREDSGQGLAEFALALPIILIIMLGMVEFAHAYDRVHGLAGLSREGANIAARGTALTEVLTVVMANGQTLQVPSKGGAIVSRVVVQQGTPTVQAQVASAGFEDQSKLSDDQDQAAQWIAQAGFAEGSTHYAVEVFLTYDPVTPLSRFLGSTAPSMLYERAVF